jgi:nucleoside-diphosphate-sugar epimerase
MKILVTGCAGFIGSHCCERLLALGHSVIGIDNFSRFYNKAIKEQNLSNFLAHPRFSFYQIDIRNKGLLDKELTEKVDLVMHLAAKAGVRPSIQDPEAYIDVNIKGTQHILEWMRKQSCKKLFFASSSSVYGNNPNAQSVKESDPTDEPISPYAFTKKSAELMNHTYHHLYGMDVINARFFTVYGPRQRPDLAIHKFMDLISRQQPIELYGDGSSARDYTYIEDTVNGIMASIDHLHSNEGVFETINLGNQHPIKLSELIEIIFKTSGRRTELVRKGMQAGDVDLTYANIEKAKALIGYEPLVDIEEGMRRFWEWFKSKPQKN